MAGKEWPAGLAIPWFVSRRGVKQVYRYPRSGVEINATGLGVYTSILHGPSLLPELSCWCRRLGRRSRAFTHFYKKVLRPVRLPAAQPTILEVRWRAGQVSPSQLGEMLDMDSTTLTRALAVMI